MNRVSIHCIAFVLVASLLLLPHPVAAADIHPFVLPDGFVQEVLAKDLGPATAFAIRPDGSILIARKHGSVKVWRDGTVLEAPFIDISGELNNYGDRGLMGIAVHPNYPASPYVYLAYVYEPSEAAGHAESGARTARVIRVETSPRNPDKVRDGSTVVLIGANGTPQHAGDLDRGDRPPYSCFDPVGDPVRDCLPVDGPSHTVDGLVFGPDGALYISAGDGTLQPDLNVRAQNIDSLAGKILRVNPLSGAGYPDNPFYDGDPSSNRSKVFALGLRNPYRFTFDSAGQLVVGDVGGERWEEINRGGPGANFGWPCLEGPLPNSNDPACAGVLSGSISTTSAWHGYSHEGGYSAAIGGDFNTADRYPAAYHGAYFFADHNRAALLYLPADDSGDEPAQEFATNVIAPVQITLGPDGSLYVLSFVDGALSRIRYTGERAYVDAVTESSAGTVTDPGTEESASDAASSSTAPARPQASADGPRVHILAPNDGSKWPEGAEIKLSGEAVDADGTHLDGANLQWTATLHHNEHIHPDFFHGEGTTQTFRFEPHAPNIFYELCLTATDSAGHSATACVNVYQSADRPSTTEPGESGPAGGHVPASDSLADGEPVVHGVQRHRWLNLGGATIADLIGHPTYPDEPDEVTILPAFETGSDGKDYGERLIAYLTPPTDGDYLFMIAADDSGELWLSTDTDPANAQLIAYTTTWTGRRDWDKHPTQVSAPISLKAGTRYYIEARHKQADQKANLSIAWQPPNADRTIIESIYLTPD